MKWTVGSVSYTLGVLLALVAAVIGTGLGTAAVYVTAVIALMAIMVGVLNISAAEGQKFLLWTIAMGVVGVAAFSGSFSGIGLKVAEDALKGIGQFFMFVAVTGVVVYGHKLSQKK